MYVNLILLLAVFVLALVAGYQWYQRRKKAHDMFVQAVWLLVELFKDGTVASFGCDVEQYENKNDYCEVAYLKGRDWKFYEKEGFLTDGKVNSGNIPGSIWALHGIIFCMGRDVEDLFAAAATKLSAMYEHDRLFKVVEGQHKRSGAYKLAVYRLGEAKAVA